MMRIKVPGGRADRAAGPRDRRGGRRLRRGTRRTSAGLRQPLRRPHDPPGHPDPLDPHRRRPPHLAALLRTWASPPSRPAATRPATCCSLPGLGGRRRRGVRRPSRSPRPSRTSSPATASTPTCPASSRSSVTGCLEDCAQAEINDIGLWPAADRDGHARVQRAGRRRAVRRRADGLGHRRLRPARPGGRALPGPSPSSSASSATGRTAAWPACATWSRSSGPRGSGPSWRARPASTCVPAGEELTTPLPGRPRRRPSPEASPACVYVGCSVPVGRMHGIELVEAARLAETYGDGTVRLGTDQNFVLTGRPRGPARRPARRGAAAEVLALPRALRAGRGGLHRQRVLPLRRRRDQGAGREVGPLPRRAAGRRAGRRARPGGTRPAEDAGVIRMHFSGCSASCAQPQIADIGFRGDIAHVGEHIVEAVDIGMGGSLGPDAAFIDWVDRRPAGRRRPRRPAARGPPLPGRAPAATSPSTTGPGARPTTSCGAPDRSRAASRRWSEPDEALPHPRGDERHRRAARARCGSGSSRPA